jgi:hypothetical protein
MILSPLHFHLSIFVIEKPLPDSASRRVGNSPTRRVADSLTWRVRETLREKRQHQKRLFAQEGRLFHSEIRKERPEYESFGLFLWPSIITLYKKSLLYFKSVDFLP